eukprot:03326.XXX_117436_117618_1 [CDS] Oithona nana genome sequencing.
MQIHHMTNQLTMKQSKKHFIRRQQRESAKYTLMVLQIIVRKQNFTQIISQGEYNSCTNYS